MSDTNIFGEILIVEDNPGDVRLTKEMLKETGLNPEIHVVTDGNDALRFLRQRGEYRDAPRPDVILLDLHLSRMDGEEVLEEMNDDARDIPIIAMTGSEAGAELKLNDIGTDVDACLVKPLEPDELRDAARTL